MASDILYIEDDVQFDDNINGVMIHAECLSQDFDDIGWEPESVKDDDVDPTNDTFGFYNN